MKIGVRRKIKYTAEVQEVKTDKLSSLGETLQVRKYQQVEKATQFVTRLDQYVFDSTTGVNK